MRGESAAQRRVGSSLLGQAQEAAVVRGNLGPLDDGLDFKKHRGSAREVGLDGFHGPGFVHIDPEFRTRRITPAERHTVLTLGVRLGFLEDLSNLRLPLLGR